MRLAGLVGASRRCDGPITTQRDKQARPAPDLEDRDFHAAGPNQLWSPTSPASRPRRASSNLAVVVDVWSRRSSAGRWLTSCEPSWLWTPEHGPRPASAARGDPSFRPGQPICLAGFREALQGGRRTTLDGLGRGRWSLSSGRQSRTGDNALCESFFASLECDLLDRRCFASQVEARMACFSFIEGFYNPTRRRSALGYRSPICDERRSKHTDSPPPPEPSTKPGQLHRFAGPRWRTGARKNGKRNGTNPRHMTGASPQRRAQSTFSERPTRKVPR